MNCDNTKIKVISVYSGEDEAKYVVEEIEAQKRRGNDYSQMAVLVRTAFQTREFEEKFIAEAIPYQVIGGPKFYERAEIRDALAYFRVVCSHTTIWPLSALSTSRPGYRSQNH